MADWNPQANDIFVRAVDIAAPADRQVFLDRQCGGDAALRRQVESLLAAGEKVGSFLDRPAVQAPAANGATAAFPPLTEGPGTVIGPYKLLQQIGEGGFGVVYMAEQEQPVRRKVALKIIKPGMDSREVIARFEAERQALALMDHPNIARVFDAGATESGRPYFVMELVRGVPVTEFCDKNHLPAGQRLQLFITVCHAIQHAHHKGIIHRDIKPSNVMITLHDGLPVVKVIDFGVAKATAQKLTERTLFTAYGQMIGTPAYMSPEQAEMSGLDIDTRSDIFSLGVLLYELLTGTTPLDGQRLRQAGYAEMQRLIREEEAPRPSTRFSSLGGEATVLANNRGTDARRLAQLLRSDLDWVVMKALDKDRNRRYGSPDNFAADVERYLTEQPVEARPPSAWYRFGKLARRNKVALTTAALVAAALLLGTAASAWQAVRATRAEAAALGDRDRALAAEQKTKVEKDNTQAALAFLWQDVLSQASPLHEPDRDLKVRTLLDRVANRLDKGSGPPPLVEAAIRKMVGELYTDLGEPGKAQSHLERALDVQVRELGQEDPQTLASMHALGVCLYRRKLDAEAAPVLSRTLELRRRILGDEHPDTLLTMRYAGLCYENLGRIEDAERLLREAVATRSRVSGEQDQETLLANHVLGSFFFWEGRLEEAKALFERCLEQSRKLFGEDHPSTLKVKAALCRLYLRLDEGAQAEVFAAQVLKDASLRMHALRHNAKTMLALAYQLQNRHAEASKLIEELVAERRTGAGGRAPSVNVLELLGRDLIRQGKYSAAEQSLRENLKLIEQDPFLVRQYSFRIQVLLGASLLGQKKYAAAEKLLLQGYEGRKKRAAGGTAGYTPLDRRHQAETLKWLVQLSEETGKPAEAARWRKELEALRPPPKGAGR